MYYIGLFGWGEGARYKIGPICTGVRIRFGSSGRTFAPEGEIWITGVPKKK